MFVFRNQTCLPRARIVFRYEVMSDREKILERMAQPDFDYRNSIILEQDPDVRLDRTDTSTAQSRATVERDEIDSHVVKAELTQPGFLVLSENYYPSWKAYVDGKEAQIYRADYLFRAVYLDRGEHEIRFVFESAPYRLGKASTLLTCVVLLAMFIFYLTRRARLAKASPQKVA